MHQQLIDAIAKATNLPQEQVVKFLTRPKDLSHGDISFACFAIAKAAGSPPPQVASDLAQKIPLPAGVDRCQAVGPYINFFLNRAANTQAVIGEILKRGKRVGEKPQRNETIVIDYSSPNIAKPFHVGHLRTTLIGLSLDRLFRHRGYKVVAVNHLGDWGTQFGFVWVGYVAAGKPETFTIDELVDYYIAANKQKKQPAGQGGQESEEGIDQTTGAARDFFLRLEAGEDEALEFWQKCLGISVSYLKKFYTRLGIQFDEYQGESFYRPMLAEIEQMIKNSGILENSEGALGIDCGKKLGFARIFSEDGRSLYITRDVACAVFREEEYKPSRILYVVASQQSLHFQQLKMIMERLKHPSAEKIVHVGFGFVPGMKTRDGGAIALKEFLDEAKARAETVYKEQVETRPEGVDQEAVAEAVAIGAMYFYFLNHSNIKDFQFRWDEALNFQGDSGPYLQYTVARLNSIEAKARESGIVAEPDFDGSLLSEDSVRELVTLLSQFDEVLEKIERDYEPNHLAELLLGISRAFNRAYRELRVVGQETPLAVARLSLFQATRTVLSTGMHLIGVPVIERM